MSNKKVGRALTWLRTSVWAFPLVLLVLLTIFTALKISGSSVGVYHPTLYGKATSDPDLLFGSPKPIRSDEWLSMTQVIVSQSLNGFPRFNPDLGSGRDLSLQPEVPIADWPTLFKPQNWSFFVLPLEQAFAFKWWLLMYLLVVGCYFFSLRILPDKKLLAILFSLGFGLSPFLLWWYQTGGFLTIAYGFFILLLGMRIINGEQVPFTRRRRLSDALQVGALAFVISCFGLILYPPFQVPVAIVCIFFLLGYVLQKYLTERVNLAYLLRRLGLMIAAAIIAAGVGLAFIYQSRDVIETISDTVYPGARTVNSGDLKLLQVFNGFLMPILQSGGRGPHFLGNQSEASNFILLLPFLILPGFILMLYEYKRRKNIDWLFGSIQVLSLLFLLRAFVPVGDSFYRFLLLDKVPNKRLIIGIGFLGAIQLILIIRKMLELKQPARRLLPLSLVYGAASFAVLVWAGLYARDHYPLFVRGYLEVFVLAALFSFIIILLLARRITVAIVLFLLFSMASGFRVIPLYQGLGFLTHSQLVKKIKTVSKPSDTWVTVDNVYFDATSLLADRRSLTGVQVYPDLKFWEQAGGKELEFHYNRQGHILFSDDQSIQGPFKLVQSNFLHVKFECSDFVKKVVDYALATHPLDHACTELVETVNYPNISFYLYKVID